MPSVPKHAVQTRTMSSFSSFHISVAENCSFDLRAVIELFLQFSHPEKLGSAYLLDAFPSILTLFQKTWNEKPRERPLKPVAKLLFKMGIAGDSSVCTITCTRLLWQDGCREPLPVQARILEKRKK